MNLSIGKALDELTTGDHGCVVVDSDEQHWEVAAGYVAGGLARREKVLYLGGERSVVPLLRRLREEHLLDVEQVLRTGQLALFPPEVTNHLWAMSIPDFIALVDRTISKALAEGYSSVRATDEVAAAARPGGLAMIEYERAFRDELQGRYPATMLCQYERPHWSVLELDEACELHEVELVTPALYDDGLLRITRCAPFGTRVAGEIDFSNRHLVGTIIDKELDRALRAAKQTGEIEVHLESLRFAEVTSVAQFVQAAEGFPQSHRLVLHGVHPSIRRLLDRCGAGFCTQLTIRETPA